MGLTCPERTGHKCDNISIPTAFKDCVHQIIERLRARDSYFTQKCRLWTICRKAISGRLIRDWRLALSAKLSLNVRMKSALAGFVWVLSSVLMLGQGQNSSVKPAIKTVSGQASERLSVDTAKTTVLGNSFVAAKDWSIRVAGSATILEAPERNSWVALIDVQAKTQEEALARAWQAYKPDAKWPVKVSTDQANEDGWSQRRSYEYLTSPNEKRTVGALVSYSRSSWNVVIVDMADAVAEKRCSQVALVFGRLLPKGYSRESFAEKKPKTLDQARIAELTRFVEQGQKVLGMPGVAFGTPTSLLEK